MISLQEVRKVYNAGRPNEFAALRGISLQIAAGTTTVLQGPSGSGKTTLLSIIGCMARPTAGRVFLFGQEVTSLPERFLTEIRRETSGVIFQHFNLIRGVTCLENVMFPGYVTGESHRSLQTRALAALARFRLEGKASSRVEWLSGGELQRVAIARALINDPPLLLADEPTAHLDSALSAEFLGIAEGLRAQGKTLIIASHDPAVCEAGLVDRVIRIHDGQVVDGGEAGP